MIKEATCISDAVLVIQLLTERIQVLVEDLTQDYFGKSLKSEVDALEITHGYYNAGIKTDIIFSMAIEADEKLAKLQESLKHI